MRSTPPPFTTAKIEPHRFVLTKGVIAATTRKDACAILRDLAKFDLLHLPYASCWVTYNADDMLDDPAWVTQDGTTGTAQCEVTFAVVDRHITVDPVKDELLAAVFSSVFLRHNQFQSTMECDVVTNRWRLLGTSAWAPIDDPDFGQQLGSHCVSMVACLIASLAARNINKVVSTNTRLLNGKKSRPAYLGTPGVVYHSNTVLHVPATIYDNDCGGTHASPIPHLRRGHEHTFRHGAGRAHTFKKFLPPVYVNADPSFRPTAKQYMVIT